MDLYLNHFFLKSESAESNMHWMWSLNLISTHQNIELPEINSNYSPG